MAIDSGKVGEAFIELRARMDQLDGDLRKAQTRIDGAINRVNQRSRGLGAGLSPMAGVLDQFGASLSGIEAGFGRIASIARVAMGGAVVGAVTLATNAIAEAGNQITQLRAKFEAVSGDSTFFDRIVMSANQLGVSFEAAGAAATRFAIVGRDIGLTTAEVDKLNQTIIRLGQIGGSTPAELATGMTQLAQAVGSANVQWDEMRSVLEATPLVIREIADQMGMTVSQLKAAGAAGQVSGRMIAEALLRAFDGVEERARQIPESFERAGARVSNSWTNLLATLDRAFNASALKANVYNWLSDAMDQVALLFGSDVTGQTLDAAQTRLTGLQNKRAELERAIATTTDSAVRRGMEGTLASVERKAADLEARVKTLRESMSAQGDQPLDVDVQDAGRAEPQVLVDAKREAEQAQQLLAARRKSVAAYQEMKVHIEAVNTARKEGIDLGSPEFAALEKEIAAKAAATAATDKLGQSKVSAAAKSTDAVAQAAIEADAQRRLAEAYGVSLEAGERMASVIDAEREARSANIAIGSAQFQQLAAETIARDQAAASVDKQRQAMENLRQLSLDTAALDREAASLREQAALVGQDGAEALIARKQAELELANREIDVQGQVAQAYLASNDARNRSQDILDAARENVEIEQRLADVRTQRAGISSSADAGELARQQAINDLRREGIALDSEVAQRRIELAGRLAEETAELERQKDIYERIGDAAAQFGQSAAEGLTQAIRKGEDLGDVFDTLLDQLIELAIRMSITEPAGNLFGQLARAAAGALGGMAGGTAGAGYNPYNYTVPAGGLRYAKGGTFEGGTGHRNEVVTRPTVFAFARGGIGLMGEGGGAGEGILPLKRGRSGNLGVEASGMAPVVEFHVHDERRAGSPPVETRREQGPDMRTIIRAFVRDEMSSQITRGDHDDPMRMRYNLRPGTR